MNENKEKLLEIRDLSVTYITDDATLYAVNGLNLDLFRGETLGLEDFARLTEAVGRRLQKE